MIQHLAKSLAEHGRGANTSGQASKMKLAMAASGEPWIRPEQCQVELSQLSSLPSHIISVCHFSHFPLVSEFYRHIFVCISNIDTHLNLNGIKGK
jgi:hypothetical protein